MLLLPPAPAALVLAGLAFATCAALSAAFRRRMAVLGPPGGVGAKERPETAAEGVLAPLLAGLGEAARGGEDWRDGVELAFWRKRYAQDKGEEE